MKIEKIPENMLYLKVFLGEAKLPDGKKVDISLVGDSLLVRLPNENRYFVSLPSIVEDVIEFDNLAVESD